MNRKLKVSRIKNFIARISPLFIVLAVVIAGCAQPADEKQPAATEKPKHVYKELNPETHPVPAGVKEALPGLLNDNIYLYREIAPTLNLVAYVPEYSREGAIKMAACMGIPPPDDGPFRLHITPGGT